jgi:phenylacetate-CoA ligase
MVGHTGSLKSNGEFYGTGFSQAHGWVQGTVWRAFWRRGQARRLAKWPCPPDKDVMADAAPPDKYHVARSFHDSLMKSQWLPTGRIIAYQERQLQQMLAHAFRQVPFYAEPLGRIRQPDGSFDLTRWEELPVLSRETVAANWDDFQARELPPGHEAALNLRTSGSETGSGFPVRSTRFAQTGVACASYRYADWFGYDFSTPLVMIRASFSHSADPNDPEDNLWGPPWIAPSRRGARHRIPITNPVDGQLEQLRTLGRVLINTLPSHAMTLAQASEERGITLDIAGVLTVGEKLSRDVRDEVKRIWGCRISDVYATAETGLVAIECPETGRYHLQPEISRIEILDRDNRPCAPGTQGHLVATALYNFAMPLIRYRFNDLATAGPACACGRGLPVLEEIAGRLSSQFVRTNGEVFAPAISTFEIHKITGAREWQLTQTQQKAFHMAVVSPISLTAVQAKALRAYLATHLETGSQIDISAAPSFPRSKGGKFYPIRRIWGL